MKIIHLFSYLFLLTLIWSCSKEFDPDDYRDGQLVTIYLDHYIGWELSSIYVDAAYERPLSTFIEGFSDRELGYRYAVQARVKEAPKNLMDTPPYWFVYVKTLDKAKVENEVFTLGLVYSSITGFTVTIHEEEDQYYFSRKYPLKPENESVTKKLEEVVQRAHEIGDTDSPIFATAIASHDLDHWGQAFIVHDVKIEAITYN